MESLYQFLEQMSPKEALAVITEAVNMIFQHADEKDRLDFAMGLIGDAGKDKIASMVNL